MSRLRAIVAGAALMATILGSGCTTVTGQGAPDVVVIAADLELSGERSALGDSYHNALQLIVDQVNEQGRLGNRELVLEVRDNRSDHATAANNIAALAADPSVTALITGSCHECLLASIEIIDEHGVPTIALAAPDAISNPVDERRNIFKLGPNAGDTAAALVSELNRAGDIETIGLVVVDDAYGEDGLRELTGAADRAGMQVVAEERISDDVAAAAARLAGWQPEDPLREQGLPGDDQQGTGPDAIVVWAYAEQAGEFAAGVRDAGYEGDLYLDAVAADDLFLTGAAGAALDNATMVFTETLVIDEVIATSPAKAARKTWFRDYTARFGTYSAFASFAADAVQLVVDAVNRFDSVDRETVRAAIEASQLDGLTGPIRMTPDSHSGLMPQALTTLVARGDRWRLAS